MWRPPLIDGISQWWRQRRRLGRVVLLLALAIVRNRQQDHEKQRREVERGGPGPRIEDIAPVGPNGPLRGQHREDLHARVVAVSRAGDPADYRLRPVDEPFQTLHRRLLFG